MSSSESSQEHSKKESSNNNKDFLGFDLLYQLTYLSTIAAAGVDRNRIFQLGGELDCSTATYFREIDHLTRSMNYQYAEACRIVGESAKSREVKSLLLRLSSSLATGESAKDFWYREAHIQAEAYGNSYETKLETLKKWTDAYIALMVSVALIVAVGTISTVIYSMGNVFLAMLVAVMVGISGLGCWVIYKTAPKDIKILTGPQGDASQRIPHKLFVYLMPLSLVTGAVLTMMKVPLGWILAVIGGLLFPIGVASMRFDNLINRLDSDISTFIRVLGATASAIGTTATEALGRMDLLSLGSLSPTVKRLHTFLRSRVDPDLCWNLFADETGSELIRRGVRVFRGGISLGGEAEEAGSRASLLTMKVNFLREKRKLVSATFSPLCLATHGAIVFLLVFLTEILGSFSKMIQDSGLASSASGQGAASGSILSLSFQNIQFLRGLVIPVIIILSVVNALAAHVTEGGYKHKLFLYLAATLIATGIGLAIAPQLAASIFQSPVKP